MTASVQKGLYRKELDTILRFSSLINSSLNIEDVLNCAMQSAEEFMDAEASSVYEVDEEKGEIFVRVARGDKKDPIKQIRLGLGEGVAGHVVKTGKPLVVDDVTREPRFSDRFDRQSGFRTKSMICVPLLCRQRTIGALQVINKKGGGKFTRADLELLVNMSRQIAIALENARLYRRLQERFQLTARELKETEEKLIRSERLGAMGHLVQGIAHEIRNPIMILGGFARRIRKQLGEDSALKGYADILLEQSERLENIVVRIGEFINLLSPAKRPEEIAKVIKGVAEKFRPAASRQGVSLKLALQRGLPKLTMDGRQIATAIANILENALESMPEGGTLVVEGERDGGGVLISIQDTGSGISKEDLDAVYDPFFTSKTRGVGLGLTMVHQIVMNHQGEIKIESRKGKGTVVRLHLPPGSSGPS